MVAIRLESFKIARSGAIEPEWAIISARDLRGPDQHGQHADRRHHRHGLGAARLPEPRRHHHDQDTRA